MHMARCKGSSGVSFGSEARLPPHSISREIPSRRSSSWNEEFAFGVKAVEKAHVGTGGRGNGGCMDDSVAARMLEDCLAFLVRTQRADGSWSRCIVRTSFSALALLATGEEDLITPPTPSSSRAAAVAYISPENHGERRADFFKKSRLHAGLVEWRFESAIPF